MATRFEQAQKGIKEMSKLICEWMQECEVEVYDDFCCTNCPWTNYCSSGHNGVEAWLKERYKG